MFSLQRTGNHLVKKEIHMISTYLVIDPTFIVPRVNKKKTIVFLINQTIVTLYG
jgi:hypothetical protein